MLKPSQFCGVKSNEKNTVTQYVENMYQALKAQGAFDLMQQIQDNTATSAMASGSFDCCVRLESQRPKNM